MDSTSLLKSRQIRAARALLDWSQEDLAEAANLSIATIRKVESGNISPRGRTMQGLHTALVEAGIEFSGTSGVRIKDDHILTLEGADCYEQFIEWINRSMANNTRELLFMHADYSRASDRELDTLCKIRARGVRFRVLSEEGDTYLCFPLGEIRWIPRKYFKPSLQVIFDEYVAICIYSKSEMRVINKVVVIHNKYLAEALRNDFNFLWDNCRKPSHTTAPQVYK